MRNINISFSKPLDLEKDELESLIFKGFEDIKEIKIKGDLKKNCPKALILLSSGTKAEEILEFLKNYKKGVVSMSQVNQPNQTPAEFNTAKKACEDLGNIFSELFGKTGGLSQTLINIQTQLNEQSNKIKALENVVLGSQENQPNQNKSLSQSIKDATSKLDMFQTQSKQVVDKLAKIETFLKSIQYKG